MHASMEMRRQRRIIYQTRIRLRTPGSDQSVIARVDNLSPRGVFVVAPEIPAAGSEVHCSFTLAGERRTLRGRVAWVRPPSAAGPSAASSGPGAGIEFLDLDDQDQRLLGRLVDPPPEARVAVDVSFEGLAAPVRCKAVMAGDGLRLVTGLPFMRLSSRVAVRFPGSSGEHHEGTIESVTLEPSGGDGIPQLELDVSLSQAMTPAPFMLPQLPLSPQASPAAGPPPATVISASMSAPPPPRPAGGTYDQTVRMPMSSGRVMRAQLDAHTRRIYHAARKQWRPLATGAALGGMLVAVLVSLLSAPPPTLVSAAVPSSSPPPPPSPSPLPPTSPSPSRLPAPPPSATEAAPLSPSPAPPPESIPGIDVAREGQVVRVSLPLIGSVQSADPIRLEKPPGLAITLPRARPRALAGSYVPPGTPVKIQIRRRGPGSQLRFFYDPARFSGKLTARPTEVVLELTERDRPEIFK